MARLEASIRGQSIKLSAYCQLPSFAADLKAWGHQILFRTERELEDEMGMAKTKATLLNKLYRVSPTVTKRRRMGELVRVYHDLEKTLRHLKESAERTTETSLSSINVRKLILQLSRSKKRIERKIGNTILIEKQHLKKRIRNLTSSLSSKEREV